MNKDRQVTKLTHAKLFAVANELKAMKADIQAGKHTAESLAKLIAIKLGFPITAHNVESVFEAAGLKPIPEKSNSNRVNTIYQGLVNRLAELERRVLDLENAKTTP